MIKYKNDDDADLVFLSHMRIVTGRPVLMAHTDFIEEGIYAGAGICRMGVQY